MQPNKQTGRPACLMEGQSDGTVAGVDNVAVWHVELHPTDNSYRVDHTDVNLFAEARVIGPALV